MQVAPIYADPWTKTTFLANAIIVTTPYWSKTQTIGAVTCTLYLVRFFYSEALKETFIDDADVTDWTDLEVHNLDLSTTSPLGYQNADRTILFYTLPIGQANTRFLWIALPPRAAEDQIKSFTCLYAMTLNSELENYVSLSLRSHRGLDPAAAGQSYATIQSTEIPQVFTPLTYTFATPPVIAADTQLSLRIVFNIAVSTEYAQTIYAKCFSISTIRLV